MDSSKRTLDLEEDTDGSICSIHVRNFFCHDNLQIDLNRNVNFVVGRNGSGKSAILTALVVGLGGKAAATNRGNNLQSFIKKGANSATVEIKIRNSSNLAYKPEIYGSYITVSRTINNSGGSSYKIKNASGEVVSTKFEEVKNIVIAHDIQVDNPISVLNQDDARSFHASDAKKKFTLFKRATNMDRTETNYEKALDNCKVATNTWKRKKEACDVLENEYKKLKVTHDRLQSHSEMEKRQKELENEYYWSEVVQYEREEQEIQEKRNKQQARVDKLEHELEAMEKSAGSNNGVVEQLNAQLRQHNKQRGQLESELQALQEQLFAAQAARRGVAADAAKRAEQRRRERKKVADLKDGIAAIESGDASAKRAELERAAAAAREGADAARARYDTARNDAQQARQNAADAAARLDHAAAPPQRARAALRELKSKLQELGSGGDDALAVYGAKMAALVRAVKEATARGVFSAPPRGPVGAYVKVRDAKWAGALEHVLGGKLMEFCVNTDRDQRALFDIMRRIYGDAPKPGVTYSRFLPRRHDVTGRCVRGGRHPSALDLMLVEDPVVANHLIDQLDVERVLMVAEHADAQRLSDRTENVPPNCKKIVTLDTTEFFPAPNYRSYGGVARASQYLTASTSERQRQLRAEIQEQETKLKQLEAAERKLKLEDADAKKAEKKAQETLELVMRDLHRKEEAQRAAAAALDTTQKPHHAVLEKELHIAEENLVALEEKLEEASQKEAEQKQKIDEIESAMRQTKKNLSDMSATCRNLAEEIDKEQMKAEQGATQQEAYRQRIPREREKLELVERALTERRAAIAGKVAAAERLCPRLARPRDKETVKQEIEATKSKLNSLRGEGRSRAEVEELMLRAAAQFRATSDQLGELQRLIAQCQKCTERHRHCALQLQRSVANLVQHHFNAMLTVNGYSGNMDIDFAKGLLDIKCTGRESSRLASSTASLSGGERSYSTVAFIMALWACVEVPFYFLDEFDVFMDDVNRRKVRNALLNHALNNRSRQFVFLTPQDASSVTASPQISIHVMADPRP